MNKVAVAKELVAIAKCLSSVERMAAVKDLAAIRAILPEVRKKQQEYEQKAQEMQRERNKMWDDATRELDSATEELIVSIKDELVSFFNDVGMGVRTSDANGGLVEVFVGNQDGIERRQSKVSAMINLTFDRSERATFMIRNENGEETIEGELSDKGTIASLMKAVKKAQKKGFWGQGEE